MLACPDIVLFMKGKEIMQIDWRTLSQAYAFLGNTLLKPMTMTSSVGLSSDFWNLFPRFDDTAINNACQDLSDYVGTLLASQDEAHAIQVCSIEFTKLFVGPPSPSAPPWETMYMADNVTVGFGQATFDMKQRLRDIGLEVSNENNQYADHLGIELLYLAQLCSSSEQAKDENIQLNPDRLTRLEEFIQKHPLSWIISFRDKIEQTYPDGYFVRICNLIYALLVWNLKWFD